jgi:hypothetical protein
VTSNNPVTLVQIGMRAAIRDVQEWLDQTESYQGDTRLISAEDLQAYLMAMLFTAGVSLDDDWSVVVSEHGEG